MSQNGALRIDARPAIESEFLDELDAAFLAAERRTSRKTMIRLAGRQIVQLRFADPELAERLLPALAWLECDPALPAQFEIRAFSGDAIPSCPWNLGEHRRGELAGDDASPVTAAMALDPPILTLADRRRRIAWYWTPEPERLPIWERAAPFFRLLPRVVRDEATVLAHGAALADGAGALLLVGRGGAGKSTLALGGLARGLELLGDDYLLLSERAGRFGAAPLYASAKLDDASIARLARLGLQFEIRGRETGGKSVVAPPAAARPAGDGWRTLRALLLPRIGDRMGAPTPVSAAHALRALAPSSIFQLPFVGAHELAFFARVVRRVPAFELPVGPDLTGLGEVIERLLRDRGAA